MENEKDNPDKPLHAGKTEQNQQKNEGQNAKQTPVQEQKQTPIQKAEHDAKISIQKAEEDLKERYLRLAAEFDNYKKRVQKEKMEILAHGEEKTVLAILPILDDLDAAENALKDEGARKGVEMVRQKILSILEKEGLERIKAEGKFDEILHEAVMTEKGEEDGKITKVISIGYLFRGNVLRHAKVAVSKKE